MVITSKPHLAIEQGPAPLPETETQNREDEMHLDHQAGPWDAWAETVDERLAWLHDAVEGTTSQVSHNATIVQDGFVLLKEQTKTYQAGLKHTPGGTSSAGF